MKKLALIAASILILIASATLVVSLGLVFDNGESSSVPTAVGPVPAAPSSVEGIFVLPEDGPAALIEEFDAARSSISIEVYLLTDDSVLSAIFRARDRGVTVRVLLEKDPMAARINNRRSSKRSLRVAFRSGGIPPPTVSLMSR